MILNEKSPGVVGKVGGVGTVGSVGFGLIFIRQN